jgi:hypothetical protein
LHPVPGLRGISRPGHLSGFTQYDDGVYFGNAARLVHGAIACRDFAMVQPPGSMLLTPVTPQPAGRARRNHPGHDTLPGQERDRQEPNMRGLELTGRRRGTLTKQGESM